MIGLTPGKSVSVHTHMMSLGCQNAKRARCERSGSTRTTRTKQANAVGQQLSSAQGRKALPLAGAIARPCPGIQRNRQPTHQPHVTAWNLARAENSRLSMQIALGPPVLKPVDLLPRPRRAQGKEAVRLTPPGQVPVGGAEAARLTLLPQGMTDSQEEEDPTVSHASGVPSGTPATTLRTRTTGVTSTSEGSSGCSAPRG